MPVVRNSKPSVLEKSTFKLANRLREAGGVTLPSPEGIYKGEKVRFLDGKLIVGDVVVSVRENI